MGNILFFCCVQPMAKSGKGTAYSKPRTYRETKSFIDKCIKSTKERGKNMTSISFAADVHPDEMMSKTANYFAEKGYTIHYTKEDGNSIRWDIMW